MFKNSSIAILGYGTEGKSTLQFLLKNGASRSQITILDKNNMVKIPEGVEVNLGKNYLSSRDSFDIIFRTPGITNTLLFEDAGKKLPLNTCTSQTAYFLENYTGITIGITGTKGKSTISTLLYTVLLNAGKNIVLAGNVGKPIFDEIDFNNPPEIVVYELSSFMIESLGEFSLDIGVFNTVYSTHTREHGGFLPYLQSKSLILDASKYLFVGSQAQEEFHNHSISVPNRAIYYGKSGIYTHTSNAFLKDKNEVFSFKKSDIALQGDHNLYNICSIVGVTELLEKYYAITGIMQILQATLKTFKGLEHRIEPVGNYLGFEWYNDAIATTPQATCAALDTFKNDVGAIFYGGIQGAYDHTLVAEKIIQYNIKTLLLFPDTGIQLQEALIEAGEDISKYFILHTRSIEEGVQFASKNTHNGTHILLSCGSPSFSCRSGFKEKGTLFKQAVQSL